MWAPKKERNNELKESFEWAGISVHLVDGRYHLSRSSSFGFFVSLRAISNGWGTRVGHLREKFFE